MIQVRTGHEGGLDAPYRAFMSGFPSGVAVITTVDAAGLPRGMTCTSLTSVTIRPPTLLICVDVRSGTLAALANRGMFAVNLLHAEGRPAAVAFASGDEDRFARVRWRLSADFGLPWLVNAAGAVAQCAVTDMRTVGDHAVVLGEVRSIRSVGDRAPLLYGRRQYAAWAGCDEPRCSAV
jgi:flavin reductase (DIM6/NTAB) family NADH-FMN oxidoreductase RutF